MGADGFPKGLAAALALFALLIIIRALVRCIAAWRRGELAIEIEPRLGYGLLRMLGLLVLAVLYVVLLPKIGYILSLILLIAGVVIYQGQRRYGRIIATAVGSAFAFWLLFVFLLGIPLPIGSLFGGI